MGCGPRLWGIFFLIMYPPTPSTSILRLSCSLNYCTRALLPEVKLAASNLEHRTIDKAAVFDMSLVRRGRKCHIPCLCQINSWMNEWILLYLLLSSSQVKKKRKKKNMMLDNITEQILISIPSHINSMNTHFVCECVQCLYELAWMHYENRFVCGWVCKGICGWLLVNVLREKKKRHSCVSVAFQMCSPIIIIHPCRDLSTEWQSHLKDN